MRPAYDVDMSDSSPSPVRTYALSLPPHPTSAGKARRFVLGVLSELGRDEWIDAAELAVSEVVTNAVIHAHTPLEVRVLVGADSVRVEVQDSSPALPIQRSYHQSATTGRGLELVELLTTACGVEPIAQVGKVVWFTLGAEPTSASAGWNASDAQPSTEASLVVLLLGMPMALWLAAQEHHDALMREFFLYQGSEADESTLYLAELARAMLVSGVDRALNRARAAGVPSGTLPIDRPGPLPDVPAALDVEVLADAADAAKFAVLQDVLDRSNQLAAKDLLLIRPALPEIVGLRDWCCEQVIAQLSGVEPLPWGSVSHSTGRGHAMEDQGSAAVWDSSSVRHAPGAVLAADDNNRIVAMSPTAARLLGWSEQDLVGQRVVAVIPPELREAHVAGFTRHLTTGVTNAIGVPLTLPVLTRSGDVLQCRFLIEKVPAGAGRAVYVAQLTPIDSG